jgi:probable phosphoglycerate mutase
MATFGFVRHGETDWNQEGRAQGLTDVPLNAEGIRQAEKLASRLAVDEWDLIFSSDLARAKETAEIIAAAMKKEVNGYDLRLREKTHGRLDGTTVEDRVKLWGVEWRQLDHGEEPISSIVGRSLDFIREMAERYPHKRILIVSHGAWILHTLEELLDHPQEIPYIGNASLSVLESSDTGWTCTFVAA